MSITSFIFENNNNNNLTIPSLIVSLFFKENILINNTYNNIELIYLYNFLNDKFINKLKNNNSILNRDLCFFEQLLDDIYNKNINFKKLNIKDMFTLISFIFKIDEISVLRKNIITKNISAKVKYKFIELNLNNNNKIFDINSMIHSWITMNDDLYINYINNIPSIIPLYINRYNRQNIYNNSNVIIQNNINIFDFYKNDEFNTYIWAFYSTICYCLNTNQYYTILNYNNEWYLFNDNNVPCFNKIFMNDNMIVNKIKKESIFVFYKLVE